MQHGETTKRIHDTEADRLEYHGAQSAARLEVAALPKLPAPAARPDIAHWHGSTAACLAVLPYTGQALKSCGALLAEGVAPMGGELFLGGLNPVGVSHRYISAMRGTQDGLRRVWDYATLPGQIDEAQYNLQHKELLQTDMSETTALFQGLAALRLKQLATTLDSATVELVQSKIEFLEAHMQSEAWQLLLRLRGLFAGDDACAVPTDSLTRPGRGDPTHLWSWNLDLEHEGGAFPTQSSGEHLGTLIHYLDGTYGVQSWTKLNGQAPDAFVRQKLLIESSYIRQHAAGLFAHAQPRILMMAQNVVQQVTLGMNLLRTSLAPRTRVQLDDKDKAYLFRTPPMPLVFASSTEAAGVYIPGDGDEICFAGPLRLGCEVDIIVTLPRHLGEVRSYLRDHGLHDRVQVITRDVFAA